MKYLFVGAGAMGCVLAGHMTRAGKDVTMIARGENLDAIRADGLKMNTPQLGDIVVPVRVVEEREYDECPDVVIVAVKAYALDSIMPLLDRVCGQGTAILPLLNAIRIGDRIAEELTADAVVLEGVAYVACERLGPGNVRQKLEFFDIVYGMRLGHAPLPVLELIRDDLVASSATATISPNTLQSALRKFARVSTVSAVLLYYGGRCGDIVSNPDRMEYLEQLCREIDSLATAAGCPFPLDDDVVKWTLESVQSVFPQYRTSLKTDFDAGRPLEVQTQFVDVYKLGKSLGLPMRAYEKVVRKFAEEEVAA